jgi:protein-S-isoprenylcysteine O-methyltransferase Ste14
MKYINAFFVVWSLVAGLGTLAGLFKHKANWDKGVAISGGVTLLYAALTLTSALGFLAVSIPKWWVWTVAPIGFTTLFLSQALNVWAAREMKRNFSPRLAPVPGGTLVTTGPFQICRHPIMLGMLMSWVGTALALGSVAMFVAFGLASILIMRRVAFEEKFLEETYGESYREYKKRVSVIVPCLDPNSEEGQELERAVELIREA